MVVGLVLLAWLLPALPVDRARRADILGIVLSGAGVVALTFGLIEAGERGWLAISALAPILAGVALQVAAPLHRRLGVKVVGAGGFLVIAAGLVIGAVSGSGHGYGCVALWGSLVGVGLGARFSRPWTTRSEHWNPGAAAWEAEFCR
ncbi:hypothetical protein [Amycolatopsis thermoflava]|uniref:hypothetical protein n=1 Tax=Amycolatopsis thermoflava TaxID=84480 RepID=UPI001E3F8396|nr:hypothetical protein [Amycolatopsis thermoflava]